MQRIPEYHQDRRQRPGMVRPKRRPQRKKHFRFELLIIPATILCLIWFVNGIEPAGTWDDFLDYIGVRNKTRFSGLACLGLTIVTIVAIARVLRDSKEKED